MHIQHSRRGRATAALAAGLLVVAGGAAAGDEAVKERIDEALAAVNPELSAEAVRPTPLEGIYEVVVRGEVVYMSGDGRYLIQGDIVDLEREESISEAHYRERRRELVGRIPDEAALVYPAAGEPRARLTVITDIECPHCQRLHRDLDELREAGVEVRYLLYAPQGRGSSSYRRAVAVWCAEDRHAAMDRAKGPGIQGADDDACEHPVGRHLELARELGVRGTPTFVSEDGTVATGYPGAQALLDRLGL